MSKLVPPVGPEDHALGPVDASVTLVEYGDYECPYCGRAHVVVAEVRRIFGPDLRFVFRNFPLAEIHPRAREAAEAAEAAGAQGRFWPMHNTLYENQEALELEDLLEYAETLGLSVPRFAEDLKAHAYLEKVKADFRSGVRSGVNGTPTFFIDGARLDASWDLESLTSAVRGALLAKRRSKSARV